ncbi:hypothetical protein H8E50_00280 [bacterium]|nr:hypothetical protein [bacterium]
MKTSIVSEKKGNKVNMKPAKDSCKAVNTYQKGDVYFMDTTTCYVMQEEKERFIKCSNSLLMLKKLMEKHILVGMFLSGDDQ